MGSVVHRRPWMIAVIVCLLPALMGPPGVSAAVDEVQSAPTSIAVPAPADLGRQGAASAAAVVAALREPLKAAAIGSAAAYVVVDPSTGSELAGRAANTPTTPASTTKILTAVAALRAFGPDARITTTVTQQSPGTLTLVGRGDPMLRVDGPAGEGATLTDLAARTVAELRVRHPAGPPEISLSYDDSLFVGPTRSPAWRGAYTGGTTALVPPITALMANRGFVGGDVDPVPAAECARVFATKLRAAGIKVKSQVNRATVSTAGSATMAPNATPVAQVFSPPMAEMVGQMLRESDNVTAEVLGHLAGGQLGHTYSFAGGATATGQALNELGVDTAGLVLDDASGLSRTNLIPPTTLAGALTAALGRDRSDLWPLPVGLAVAGFDGTLVDRFSTTATRVGRGYVRAKTGTLSGVSGLAGTVVTRDGVTLVFAFLAGRAGNAAAAAAVWDRAAAALAACNCRVKPTGGTP